ncbi:hypothetical protein AB1N83_014211 [Pleurotus pulmonarius]
MEVGMERRTFASTTEHPTSHSQFATPGSPCWSSSSRCPHTSNPEPLSVGPHRRSQSTQVKLNIISALSAQANIVSRSFDFAMISQGNREAPIRAAPRSDGRKDSTDAPSPRQDPVLPRTCDLLNVKKRMGSRVERFGSLVPFSLKSLSPSGVDSERSSARG